MKLKYSYQPALGIQPVISPENSDLNYISLRMLNLSAGQDCAGNSGGEELALVILTGVCTITVDQTRYVHIGGRKRVFDGPGHTVYVPPQTDYAIKAEGGPVEVALAGAVADHAGRPALITPEMVSYKPRGIWHWKRHIYDVITSVNPVSQRLTIIEVVTPPGHWSSVPPHKHDVENPPWESNVEEIYFYKMNPEQGFGFQRIYTDDRSIDEALVVEHNCATIQPKGYHPVANHPGYHMYYLNILGGQNRTLIPYDDPQHAWVKDLEQTIREREQS